MENHSSELIKFLPDVDLTDFKPYGNSKHILELKRLRPEHALVLQKALNRGTDHIAGYFAWAVRAGSWNTKKTLFWIQAQLRQDLPSEHFAFFLGKDLVGMGSLLPYGHPRHVQMAYWVAKGYLHQGIGESIARTVQAMALKHRPYQFVYINHDSSNRKSGAIPQKIGYKFVGTFDSPIHAKNESGLWFSWVKESDRYAECVNERLMDLRFANMWCDMIKEMHIDIYVEMYEEDHLKGLKLYREELENVRTKNEDEVA
jgi:RimJ/RimL family protein N-acetyltransferase